MYRIEVSPDVDKAIRKWKKSNPILFKKLHKIFQELVEHPRTGLGHPEQLKGKGGDVYSRRITAHDRLIYEIYDDVLVVLVLDVEGHYNDK